MLFVSLVVTSLFPLLVDSVVSEFDIFVEFLLLDLLLFRNLFEMYFFLVFNKLGTARREIKYIIILRIQFSERLS